MERTRLDKIICTSPTIIFDARGLPYCVGFNAVASPIQAVTLTSCGHIGTSMCSKCVVTFYALVL